MPPRYAYWTILIDEKPTAFRAREREELLPTFHQLQRKNPVIVLKWYAHGKLWDNPEQARWAAKNAERRSSRGRDWRPGGEHKDPRARFTKPGARRRTGHTRRNSERTHGAGPRPPDKPLPHSGESTSGRHRQPRRAAIHGDRRDDRNVSRGRERPRKRR